MKFYLGTGCYWILFLKEKLGNHDLAYGRQVGLTNKHLFQRVVYKYLPKYSTWFSLSEKLEAITILKIRK